MKIDVSDWRKIKKTRTYRKKSPEATLQKACFRLFRYTYPSLSNLFFMIKNDGNKTIGQGYQDKKMGIVPGVADSFLSVPSKSFHGAYIEFKHGYNKQTDHQKDFEKAVTYQGYFYTLIYSVDEFEAFLKDYFS